MNRTFSFNVITFHRWFSADFAKYCFLAVFVTFVHLFFICLRAKKFSLDGHLLYLFLIQDNNRFAQLFCHKRSLISHHSFLF